MKAIGFANKFFTLWEVEKRPVYITDSYGKHWLQGYNTVYSYLRNISFDLESAQSQHPDAEYIEDLKGKNQSWTRNNTDDLCPEIMKFGKYRGGNLNEIVNTDFNYVLWLVENSSSSNAVFARTLPPIAAKLAADKAESDREQAEKDRAISAVIEAGEYTFVPDRNLKLGMDNDENQIAYLCIETGLFILFPEFSVQYYNGFDYALPVVSGKAKRIKGKTVTVKITQYSADAVMVTGITIK